MRLDCEAIAGLPCLEEALDCFRDAGLLQFVTDKEDWNEELLLQFFATLHIRGYNRDPKTWVLEWMTGNVHHEAKAKTAQVSRYCHFTRVLQCKWLHCTQHFL